MEESLKKDLFNQASSHVSWLKSLGFDVESLEVGKWVKCRGADEAKASGAFAYRTWANELRQGGQGLVTVAKVHGKDYKHETLPNEELPQTLSFRLSFVKEASKKQHTEEQQEKHHEAARRAYGFWQNSSALGTSEYLTRKGVGSYGLRFRSSEQYGQVAVVPIVDASGKLWSYQLLNADGSKVFAKEGRIHGCFHCLAPIVNGQPLGVAESYVTAATCYELTSIPTVCAFACYNLAAVSLAIRQKYPDSAIVLFADNDRHLPKNEGLLKAQEACNSIENALLLAPDFEGYPPSRSASDWNDLLHLKGKSFVLKQMDSISKLLTNTKR